jgi:hypothetical protein
MIKLEQLLIWLGIAALGWMIIFLSFGESLDPALVARFTGSGAGPYAVAVLFLAGSLGVLLLAANLGRGRRSALGWRLFSLGVFLLMLLGFGRLYATMPMA